MVHAQRYNRPARRLFLGAEGFYGSRSLQLTSNIEEINKLVLIGDGLGVGLLAGGRAFRVRVQQAFFSSNSFVREKAKLNETSGGINIYPLQFAPKKSSMLSPYLVTGIQMSSTKLYGSYVVESPMPSKTKKECTCTCESGTGGGGPPANPDALPGATTSSIPSGPTDPPTANPDDASSTNSSVTESESLPAQDRYLGRISTARATFGIGLEIKIPAQTRFLNFFGEIKYGQPLSSKTTNTGFRDTTVSGLLSFDVGISVGISK